MNAANETSQPTRILDALTFGQLVHGKAHRTQGPQSLDAYSRGNYPGTNIPLKPIPEDTVITIVGCRVSDNKGGWVVDRMLGDRGMLGARQYKAVHEAS